MHLETLKKCGHEFATKGIGKNTIRKLKEPLFPKEDFEKMADCSWSQ